VSLEQILGSCIGEPLEEKRLNAVFPRSVDNRFMRKDGITGTIGNGKKYQRKREAKAPEFGLQLHSTASRHALLPDPCIYTLPASRTAGNVLAGISALI
jgi:hypothetical protein